MLFFSKYSVITSKRIPFNFCGDFTERYCYKNSVSQELTNAILYGTKIEDILVHSLAAFLESPSK